MDIGKPDRVIERIKRTAEDIEDELIKIRRELHQYPELGLDLPQTHDIICRELYKIPGLTVHEHMAGGSGIVAVMQGKRGSGWTVLLRADIDALPIEEKFEQEAGCGNPSEMKLCCENLSEGESCSGYKSRNPGCMHACGHDGHAAWLIGAAKILSEIRDEWGGCIKFVFQPGEEIGKGADTLIHEDRVLEDPPVDMAFAAHGWPSIESGRIGIARRYAFGCVGSFRVKITGVKGHASWPEETIDPIAAAGEIYQHIPAILARKIGGTASKVMSVTYMQAGDPGVRNIIPQTCEFGGTMRAAKRETLEIMGRELKKETEAVCEVYGASCEVDVQVHGGAVENDRSLLYGVQDAAGRILGHNQVYIIEEDNLGGENFAEYSARVPSVYLFIGIRPQGQEEIPGLHSPWYRFDDQVLAGAAGTFAAIAYYGCTGTCTLEKSMRTETLW
ncbi:MAG: amidohydrolase [Lachnospiraceae bacterium]